MATYIENPGAYDAAIQARIKQNARIGRERRWMAEDPSRKELIEALSRHCYGYQPEDGGEYVRARNVNPFLAKMQDSYVEWGSLTGNQEAAVRKVLAGDAERKERWAAERAERGAKSGHIGEVGKRQVFKLHVDTVLSFDSDYGTFYLHIMRQADDVVIYKGSKRLGEKGDDLSVKATVKEHGERDGVRQTIITRPAEQVEPAPLPEPVEVKL